MARSLWVAGEVGALGSWCERRRRDLTRTLPLSRRVQIVVRWCVERAIVRSGLPLDRRTVACDRRTQKRRSGLRRRRRRRDLASSRARALSLSLPLSLRV